MAYLVPTTRPIRYIAHGSDVLESGVTKLGEATGVSETLAIIADEDEATFVGAAKALVKVLPELPDSGWLEADALYRYGDIVVMVRQSHNRAPYAPEKTPALFWTVNSTEEPEEPQPWKQPTGAHDAYQKGDRVTYNGQTWESTIDANVWAPGVYGWIVV
jgi:hypothetical protein